MNPGPFTRRSLAADLRRLGLSEGDAVLVHASLRRVGPIIGGADSLRDALLDCVGSTGTLLGYCDWPPENDERDDPRFRDDLPAFDPERTRATRNNGYWPELLRTTPGSRRSGNPGASMAAHGGKADWYVADHALDYGYGPQSPLGKLVADRGRVLMLGAPLDTMTLLHHAEHLADIPNKRIIRYEAPILVDGQRVWRWFEEFDTSDPPDGLAEDYFATIVSDFLGTGAGRTGRVGAAASVLVPAAEITAFAVDWIERALKPAP